MNTFFFEKFAFKFWPCVRNMLRTFHAFGLIVCSLYFYLHISCYLLIGPFVGYFVFEVCYDLLRK